MAQLDENCLFCKIIRGEVPSYTVFENDDVKAFLDISQVNPGHTLLVPKKHLVNFFDYTPEDIKRYLQYIPLIANAIKASDPKITGMNINSNNGESANQVVMHSHIPFVPRFDGDGLKLPTRNNASKYSPSDYEEVAAKIRKHFH